MRTNPFSTKRGTSPRTAYWYYAVPIFMLALAVASWFAGPLLSRLITRCYDATIAISGLSLEDLYTFAFVFLGLYFVLNSIAPSLNWIHYFFAVGSLPNPVADQKQSLYELSSALITLVAGFTVMIPAKRWARRLVRLQTK